MVEVRSGRPGGDHQPENRLRSPQRRASMPRSPAMLIHPQSTQCRVAGQSIKNVLVTCHWWPSGNVWNPASGSLRQPSRTTIVEISVEGWHRAGQNCRPNP
ncbi:hypothetical protein CDAR_565651 [Caerostris darwini]|uniref:Uncharacterized protein n=1 Tax=Caerostris darwini TaxID=1538125 RepID=A0AAV4UYS7_9ARAC|nr:hypothetical protein CDAR_565651 [Caerostris darwini]